MKYLKTFESYILEKYTGKVGEEVPPKVLLQWTMSGYFKKIPLDATKEIFSWKQIYKSKYSMSFYSKPKSWDTTIDGTIRISDHWNYIAQGKKHSVTIQDGYGQNCWAKGIWNESIQKYDIVEDYKFSTKEEYNEWRFNYISNTTLNNKPTESVIEFSRYLSKNVDDGNVYYDDGVVKGKVIKLKSWWLDVLDNNDQTIRVKEFYKKKYKLVVGDSEYTGIEISQKLGKG